MTASEDGEAARAKLGVCTTSVTLVLADRLPEVPVIATVWLELAAELLAVKVRTDDVLLGLGANDAVTPAGSVEDKANATLPLNPPASLTMKVAEFEPPGSTAIVLSELASQKPGTWGPARSLIRLCPLALPQPVARSYPVTALNHRG